jgi:hypothetical protein
MFSRSEFCIAGALLRGEELAEALPQRLREVLAALLNRFVNSPLNRRAQPISRSSSWVKSSALRSQQWCTSESQRHTCHCAVHLARFTDVQFLWRQAGRIEQFCDAQKPAGITTRPFTQSALAA